MISHKLFFILGIFVVVVVIVVVVVVVVFVVVVVVVVDDVVVVCVSYPSSLVSCVIAKWPRVDPDPLTNFLFV